VKLNETQNVISPSKTERILIVELHDHVAAKAIVS